MNRFSTAEKLNKTAEKYKFQAQQRTAEQYKEQLLSVILQGTNGTDSPVPPFAANHKSALSNRSASFSSVPVPPPLPIAEEPNGNMKSKHFGNGDGELDMLFGFFVMNGACIVFFLLFGVCVICNCAARKPKFAGSDEKKKKPTLAKMVAALTPGLTVQQQKAAKAKEEGREALAENGGSNMPLLNRTNSTSRKNGGRGSNAGLPSHNGGNNPASGGDQSNRAMLGGLSRNQRSFKSLVARAMASKRELRADATMCTLNVEEGGAGAGEDEFQQRKPSSVDSHCSSVGPPAAYRSPSGGSSRRQSGHSSRRQSAMSGCCQQNSTLADSRPHSPRISHLSSHYTPTNGNWDRECDRDCAMGRRCRSHPYECCPIHVVEVPVEVEVHLLDHHPGTSPPHQHRLSLPQSQLQPTLLLPPAPLSDQLPARRQHPHRKVSTTRSMPSDMCRLSEERNMASEGGQQNARVEAKRSCQPVSPGAQHVCLRIDQANFAVVRKSAVSGGVQPQLLTNWGAALPFPSPSHHSHLHRCSMVVPVPCECHLADRIAASEQHQILEMEAQQNADEPEEEVEQKFSVIRQNLLGPLSFDDLHYMS